MGIVAIQACLFHGIVLKFDLGRRPPEILVAIEAQLPRRFRQEVLQVPAVRIMALRAIPLRYDFVVALRLFRGYRFVAFGADSLWIGKQQLPMRRGVWIMAFGAFSQFHRSVDERAIQDCPKIRVAFKTYPDFSSWFQLVSILGIGPADEGRGEQDRNRKYHLVPAPPIHRFSSHRFSTTWQSSQDLPANGGCIVSLKYFGSLEEWGLWQFLQSIAGASM
jgi:hypothetical protein